MKKSAGPANGTPVLAPNEPPADGDGETAPWIELIHPLGGHFLALAGVIAAPGLDTLGEVLGEMPPGPDLTQKDARRWLKNLNKQGERYIESARHYLTERDNELQEVIRLLSKTIAEMSSEEGKFAESILETTSRLSSISLLEDIRAIRESLSNEIGNIKRAVRRQEETRTLRMSELVKRVDVLQEELETVSQETLRDPLTGLFNRRAFDQELRGLLERNRILPSPFLVVMFDLDDFKRINDRLGHPVGDKALQTVAKTARENLRSSDFLARYGGDEFVLILQTDSLKKGRRKIEALAKALLDIAIPIELEGKGHHLALGFSFGIAKYREGDTGESVVGRADSALYYSKQNGKNRLSTEEDLD